MIDNTFVQCNYCQTKIRLRFQLGYFDIPFDICCPECGVHIHGCREIVHGHSTTVNNASIIECKLEDATYYADFSVELPHVKITKYVSIEKMTEYGFSPFLMTSRLYGHDKYVKLINSMREFLYFRDAVWPKLTPLYDLFFNKKIELTTEHFLKISPRFVIKNELDALMALHQTTILGMNSIIEDNALKEYMEVAAKITAPAVLPKVDNLFIELGGKSYSYSLSKRLVNIYTRWMDNFEKYIPATMLSLGNATDRMDKKSFGIATTSFEDMKSFYADSYELILDFIDIAIGLNNIVVRGDYNAFPSNNIRIKKKNQVETFQEYRELVKSTRLSLLIDTEPFSKVIPLNRNVRNAIAHFNYDFDAGTQKITFSDKHKNKENIVEIYLIDLALLCYENMMILVYLDELLYSLRKIDYIKAGLCVHIKPPR